MSFRLRVARLVSQSKPGWSKRGFCILNHVHRPAVSGGLHHHGNIQLIDSRLLGRQPSSLDTRASAVTLVESRLEALIDLPQRELRGLPTVLLADGSRELRHQDLEAVRSEILEYFHRTFTLFEKLHEMFVSTPAFFEKHERLRHPPIFYLGHTAAFFVNKLHLGQFISQRLDAELEMQMAVGVDEMSWDDLDSNSYVWPSGAEARMDPELATAFVQKVLSFRRDVRLLVDRAIRERPMEWPIDNKSFWWIIMMGIEHERIHFETSSVIHRQAALSAVRPRCLFPRCPKGIFDADPNSMLASNAPSNRLLPVEASSTRLGRSWDSTRTYGWDNEFGVEQHVDVPAFSASEFLVSNAEFLDFVRSGGYATERFWSEEGWRWVSDMQPTAPRFWVHRDGSLFLRTLSEEVPMAWDWPVEVCHHEASAFCRYLSEKTGKPLRLPSEPEYMVLRDMEPTDLQESAHGPAWGSQVPGNVNLAYWASPCPVNTFQSPGGFYDVLGNVWQHSASDIDVLEGFRTHPLYDDFTVPTVDGLHSRIMGGSFMSTGVNGATRDCRYGFRRHFYQHAGFRYVESKLPVVSNVQPYEMDRSICNSLRFHFDPPRQGPGFQVALAEALVDILAKLGRQPEATRVLELGCGPGRVLLELYQRGFRSVHGGDRTTRSFQGVVRLLKSGKLRWTNYLEGDRTHSRELHLGNLSIPPEAAEHIHFHQIPDFVEVDAKKFRDFDLLVLAQPGVLGASDPVKFLASAHHYLRQGGLLAIGTQYEWRSGGDPADLETSGEKVLEEALRRHFKPIGESVDLPFEMLRTARVFESGLQHLTFWQRTSCTQS